MIKLNKLWILALGMALLLVGCGKKSTDSETAENAPDIRPEMEAYYASFKRTPPEWKTELTTGKMTQEELDKKMESVENFFQFKTLADLPDDLEWEDGMNLPDIGSDKALKGGTQFGALQDFPRTLRIIGPDSNGSFRPFLLDDVALQLAHRHPNVTEIGPHGFYYFPGIAQEWAIDYENKSVFVKIDPEAKWSDGAPVTSDDFLFMFFFFHSKYIQAPWYNDYYKEWYTGITRYDERTFAISLPNSKPDIASRVLELRPVPAHFYQEMGDDFVQRYQWRFVPTTGAYIVNNKDIKKNQSITLTRDKNWWAKDHKYFRNRFNFDRIFLTVIRDVPKSFEAFKRGNLTASGLVNLPEYWYDLLPNDDEDVENGYIHKFTFYNEVPRPTYGLWINQAKPYLDNRDIRVGINYAVNFERVIEEYFRGDYTRMRTSADGYGEFTHPTLQARPFDPNKALEYFAKAGFNKRGSDGILVNSQGDRLSFTVSTGYRTFQDLLTILKEEAAKAGLDLRVEVLDGTAGWKKAQEKNHEITFSALNVSPEMYPRYWETYHADNAYDNPWLDDGVTINPARKIKTQTNNLQSFAYPEFDALINRYRRSESIEEMKQLAFKMEELLHEDASFVPGFVRPFYRTSNWRWMQYPEDFNVKLSRSAGEYFVSWIDEKMREETLDAQKKGITFEPVIEVYDQYKEPETDVSMEGLSVVGQPLGSQ